MDAGSDAGSASGAGSAPPSAAGDAVPAAAHHQHPLWRRAAGRGGPSSSSPQRGGGKRGRHAGGGSRSVAGEAPPASRFAPISMVELELRSRTQLDGASTVASDDDERRRARGRGHGRARHDDGNADDYGDEDSDAVHDADMRPAARRRRASASARARDAEDADGCGADGGLDEMAGAAFGTGAGGGMSTALSVVNRSDTDDSLSVTSSAIRATQRRAFPIHGVSCVGCAMPTKVTAIDDFVRTSCDKMTEHALYKMAALVYRQKVVEPALAEGVQSPDWSWKDIRAHYTLHRIDPRMQRLQNVRTLQLMRTTLELQLLREDEESGERSLDHGNTDKVLKVTQQLSREISLLNEQPSSKGGK